jgi:bacteriorhodopsin
MITARDPARRDRLNADVGLTLWVSRLVWLFSEGFASFSVSFEVCAYAVLDIVAKAVFGFMVMAAHDQLGAASASSQEYV